MKRFVSTMTAGAAAAIALASVSPALAQYNGQAPAATGNGLPASTADAPAQSPVVPLGAAGIGLLLVGAGGASLVRRRATSR